jgi:serine/threonine-protein kinase
MGLNGRASGPGEGDDPLIGLTVANYRVLALIGQGGMGAVYLAHHAVLGRYAAIKVLLPDYSNNRDLVGRFFNEARATAQLRYRGFVEIFDSGTLPDGSSYLVMEYLRGVNLAAAIDWRRTLAVDETLAVLHEVATSVAFAHKHGIVHRDLKPDNIFLSVTKDESSGRNTVAVKVLDFGIAKLSSTATGGAGSARTRTGSLMGTPLYMSPEQCRGAGQVDHRSDIYSLGCIAYQALAGQPPFAFDGFGEIIAAHLNRAPLPVRAHAPSVSESVDEFVAWLLAKDPAERPQNMDAVVTAIDHLRHAEAGRGETDLLALVPPAALAQEVSATSLPAGRVVTTPMPTGGLGQIYTPAPAAKSGGTRRLPTNLQYQGGPVSISTLGGAAMQMGADGLAGGRRGSGRGRGVGIAVGVLAGVALTAGLMFAFGGIGGGTRGAREVSGRDSRREPVPAPAPAAAPERAVVPTPSVETKRRAPEVEAPTTVAVKIVSTPAGASVVEVKSGRTLGETPFEGAFPRRDAEVALLLRKRGYHPKKLAVYLDRDANVTVTLEKHAAAAVTAPEGDDDEKRKL